MDTGAAYTGSLSIMDIDSKQFWQSDPLPSLYPKEKGQKLILLRTNLTGFQNLLGFIY